MPTPNPTPTTSRLPRNLAIGGGVLVLVLIAMIITNLTGLTNFPIPGFTHPASEDREAHDFEATVMVNDQGFMPAVLKVKPKTRVYFQSQSSADHQVDVSAKAPDSEFGSDSLIVPAGGYAFTFTKKGDYKFHDGDNPTANGEVIVQ